MENNFPLELIFNIFAFKFSFSSVQRLGLGIIIIFVSFQFCSDYRMSSDAQRSSVWRSVAKASAERPDFAERERALERLTPER
jgi:hypothetical protein